jgi:serine/threonine-protein kinase
MRISIYDVQDKPLGQGGMGKVYLGSDNKGNLVAIKEMLAEYVTDSDLRARFHQEVKISSQMEHPSIVKMYASFEENSNLYLVMEYIEGETIEQYVGQRGAIDEGEAIRLMCEILSALGYAHQKGFVHRDIKPSNIMIRPNGSICLLDFGIAKDMNSNGLTIGQVTIGTDGYMSPEQAGAYNIDHRTDIYSLGCVFFYMLTGHHAIEKRPNDHETRMAIIQNDFPQAVGYNHNISANTQKILNKATHKNMQLRFQSCREFELELNGGMTMAVDNTNSVSIGRENCDINVPHQKVSRHHADISIIFKSGHNKYLFKDRSTNGTMVDGRKIHNDEIEIDLQTYPAILLAGNAGLGWDIIEEAFRKRGIIGKPSQTISVYSDPIDNPVYKQAIPSNHIDPVVKAKSKKTWVFAAAAIVAAVIFGVFYKIAVAKDNEPFFENEYGIIIIMSKKNNNNYMNNLKISTKQLKKFIDFGRNKDPKSEVFNDLFDDYRIELFKNEINSGEKLEGVGLYLEGIPGMAGYSSVYGTYIEIDKSILAFIISFDNEYSDRSGIEFRNFVLWTYNDKSLEISKYRSSDTNELYYAIGWNEELTKKQKTEMLTSFFNKLRYANVYNDPRFDKKWFSEIYTGIEEYQKMSDLFEIR